MRLWQLVLINDIVVIGVAILLFWIVLMGGDEQ